MHETSTPAASILGRPISAWAAHAQPVASPRLERDLAVDVLVVGAGITGLTTAAFLRHGGADVAVVDALDVGAGVTGRSTGHLTELVDTGYRRIEADHGRDASILVRTAARAAIEDVRRLSEQYAPAARYRRVPAMLYAEMPDDAGVVEAEGEAAERAGVAVERHPVATLPFASGPAIEVHDQAEFDPLQYVAGLARGVAGAGVPIHGRSLVADVEGHAPLRIRLEHGPTITARRLVLATHTPAGFNPIQTELLPSRSYVLGFHLPDGNYPDGLFFDTATPYHYIRRADVGDEHLLVVGGADHGTGASDGADDSPYREVLEFTRERFPGAEPRYRWSAQVFAPADGLPYVGPAPFRDGVFLAAGFDGDGLLWGTVAGRVLADLVQDIESPYAHLLRPGRIKPVAAGAAFLKENINSAVRWVSDRFASDVADAGELAPGEGGLAFEAGERLALFRDDAGVLHACDAVCPHLGCVVRWNGADRTWDCPCHGSRFTATGDFLSGPATRGLERREAG